MLSYNDYKNKAVIFIISGQDHLRFANENLVVEDSETKKIKNQMPCTKIFCVFVIGTLTITSPLLEKSSRYGFGLVFLKNNFKPYAFMGAQTEGNTILRQIQYNHLHNYEISTLLVKNKILNQIENLKQIRQKNETVNNAISRLLEIHKVVGHDTEKDNSRLLGNEGNASKIYFKAYFEELDWKSRRPRVKQDPINVLMDIGYTFLFHFIEAHLRLYGFDVYVGIYHRRFYQRKSLVCDLVEPFRCIIDKTIRKGFNLNQFHQDDFGESKNQYFLQIKKNKDYTRVLFEELLKNKKEIFKYTQEFYRAFIREKDISQYPVFNYINQEVDKDADH